MPRRRTPLPPQIGQEPQVTPLRSPVDLYYRPNVARKPQSLIFDFAPISQSIAAAAKAYREDKKEKGIQLGEKFVADNADLVQQIEKSVEGIEDKGERRAAYQKAFDKIQKDGLIRSAEDPFFRIGYSRAAARLLLGKYRTALEGRLNEAANTRDENGNPGSVGGNIEGVIGESWADISDSPAIQDFYGGQVAIELKNQVDAQFRARVAKQQADRIESETRQMLQQDIGQRFDLLLHGNDVVTSDTLQPITDFLTNEVRAHNVQDPRELVLGALELSFQRAAAVDPDEAIRAVYAAEELVVGGVKLGEDRSGVGLRLEQLKRAYLDRAASHIASQNQRVEQERKAAILKAEEEYVPTLLKAQEDGVDLHQVAAGLRDRIRQEDTDDKKYNGQSAFVIEELNRYVVALERTDQSSRRVLDDIDALIADGRYDDADALARASLGPGLDGINGSDYRNIRETTTAGRQTSQFVENNGLFNAVKGRISQTAPRGFSDEIQQRIDDEVVDLQRSLHRDFAEYVKTTAGKPDREGLHRTWLSEREDSILKTIRARGEEIRDRRNKLTAEIRKRFERHLDAENLIAQGEDDPDGTFTELEAQALREENAAAASRDRFYNLREFHQAFNRLEDHLAAEVAERGDATDSDVVNLRRSAYERLQDEYDAALDEFLADEKVDPRHFDARAKAALRRIESEIVDELFPGARRKIEAGVREGKPVEETVAEVARFREDLASSKLWLATLRTPGGREGITAEDPKIRKHPAVDADFYDTAARWLTGVDPFFGQQVNREDVDLAAQIHAERILNDDGLDDEERAGALGAILSTVGVSPEDVMSGTARLPTPPVRRELVERRLRHIEAMIRTGADRGERIKARREEYRARLRQGALEVPLEGVDLNPYTTPFFRTEAELQAFVEDDSKLVPFLKKLGVIGVDQEVPDYDYDAARAAGLGPDETGHFPSRVPSGPEEGLILKQPFHPTFHLTIQGERDAGNAFYRRDGKIYSFPPKEVPDGFTPVPAAELKQQPRPLRKPDEQAALEWGLAQLTATRLTNP